MTESKNMIPQGFNTNDAKGMKEFIHSNESSIYHGKTSDGLNVAIALEQGEGATVYIQQLTKPKWNNVIYLDAEGHREGDGVKPAIV